MLKRLALILAALLLPALAGAATWYVATTGNDSNPGTSGQPFLTMKKVCSASSAGDTLIFAPGTYTGDLNAITTSTYPARGSAGNWTIIKAATDGTVLFDGENARNMFDHEGAFADCYWQFEGLKWGRTLNSNVTMYQKGYFKFLRCGGYDTGDGNNVNFNFGNGCYDALAEGCYGYGSGRYKFLTYRGNRIIFRNCVGRVDKANSGVNGPIAVYSVYESTDCIVQNCLALDSNQTTNYICTAGYFYGSFYNVGNAAGHYNSQWLNCVAINNTLGGINSDDKVVKSSFTNVVVWDCSTSTSSTQIPNFIRSTETYVTNITFGNSNVAPGYNYHFRGAYGWGQKFRNGIYYNAVGGYLFRDITTKNFNCYFGNTNNDYDSAIGTNSITNINPIWSVTNTTAPVKYLVRVETGTVLSGRGYGGADIGANILTLIGTPGTLWGEAGYNTDTGVNMWPYPNETLIRDAMKVYANGVNGARGFCESKLSLDGTHEQTLTTYVWEYLGVQAPQFIRDAYGWDSSTPAAAARFGSPFGRVPVGANPSGRIPLAQQ